MLSRLVGKTHTIGIHVNSFARGQKKCLFPQIVERFHAGAISSDQKKEENTPVPLNATTMLTDWRFALPIGITLAIPALSQQWIILSVETQLLACFMLFSSLVYTQAGGAIAKSLEDQTQAILEKFSAVTDQKIAGLQELIQIHKDRILLAEELKVLSSEKQRIQEMISKIHILEKSHKIRNDAQRELDMMVAEQDASDAKLKSVLVSHATLSVLEAFGKQKTLSDRALESAISNLTGTTEDADPVKELFFTVFKDIKSQVGKTEMSNEEVTSKLEKELDALKTRLGAEKLASVFPTNI